MSKEERLKKLYEPRTEQFVMRDQLKTLKEIEEVQRHCTFKPQL